MENFTPYTSLAGGLLIGLAAAGMLVLNGRIAGISGITGGVLKGDVGDTLWRFLFVAGLLAGGFAYSFVDPDAFSIAIERSTGALVVAGLLVGFGTQMGNGCTSGHGICGLSRFSGRSLAAVVTFMSFAALTVFLVNHFFGGVL
ncbi:MAG: YeeE/YedE family protein [Sandaracinus sp.]|nr:YeeE/YedE family protein [Sandaracinus sp.]MCB9612989.1 YeeE/YedE family protein [Sandaracinus sp.]MCB9619133.1 YeeE/YedE family protein [Sandaracinus sp.]MCB9632716.1 YeeE/YedE family protein [Sandaracinus sp.]